MARCTAPVRGHQSATARANCPACGGSYSSNYRSYSTPSYSPSYRSGGGGSTSGGSGSSAKPRWSGAGSSVVYTIQEVRALTPIRNSVEKLAERPDLDLRDVFLCHAWDDRKGVAKELHDLLESKGVSKQRVLRTKNFRYSSLESVSFRLFTAQRMKLYAKSVLCSVREVV